MGDLSNGHDCNVFIHTFAGELIAKYRSPFLDETFEENVRYYVMADNNWEVGLYAAVATGHGAVEETFRLERMPLFAPTADDIAWVIAQELGLSEEQVQRRLEEGAEALEREEEKYRTQIEKEVAEELEVPSSQGPVAANATVRIDD